MQKRLQKPRNAQDQIRVKAMSDGFAVQVYGQTVLRAISQREALEKAAELRRALT